MAIKNMAAVNTKTERGWVSVEGVSDSSLPNKLKRFYTHFERPNLASDMAELKHSLMPPTTLTLQKQDVLNLLKATPTNKAAGPDGICDRTLKHCAEPPSGPPVTMENLNYHTPEGQGLAPSITTGPLLSHSRS